MTTNYRYLLFGLALLLSSCNPLENILDGVTFYLGTDIIENPLTIQFVDANPDNDGQPADLTVEVAGPDAEKLYTLFGSRELKADGNVLNLAIEKSTMASSSDPLEFTVLAEAPGYLPVERRFRITDPKGFRLETVPMARLASLPPGVSRRTLSLDAPETGTRGMINFATPLTNGKAERALVSIPQGTRFFDENGQPVTGSVEVDLIHFDTRQWQGRQSLPAGLDVDEAFDTGGSLGGGSFHTAGNIRLEMRSGNQEIRSLSQPLEVFIEVADDIINPFTGSFLSQNNPIPVWSRRDGSRVWDREGNAQVQFINGKLTAQYQQDHLSDWTISWFLIDRCPTPTALQFSSIVQEEDATEYHMLEIDVMSKVGTVLRKYIRLARLYDGQELFLYDVPSTGGLVDGLRVKVYEGYSFFCGDDPIFTSPTRANVCIDYAFDLGGSLDTVGQSDLLIVDMTFQARCDQADEDPLALLPTAAIFFRGYNNACNEPYRLLSTFTNGEAVFRQLRAGEAYDFLVAAGGLYREYRNVIIPKESQTFELVDQINGFLDPMTFEYRLDTLFIEYNEAEMPADVCDAWREAF